MMAVQAGTLKAIPSQGGADRDGPVLSLKFTASGCRPGYVGKEEPASAPDFLDFERTTTFLKDLPEDQFRKAIADTLLLVDDLGLNRGKGKTRAEAYLDMVTWDDKFRASWKNDNSSNSSSCGMLVRNVLWLCGVRGGRLFDEAYKPTATTGVLSDLVHMDANACKGWNKGFTAKTFFPKVGDVFYVYNSSTNSQHIFALCAIDKEIREVDGQATVLEADGTPAGVITFTSVDGGQLDDTGPDGNGASKSWGAQGIRKVERKMKLNNGRFPNVGVSWPFPDGKSGRPIVTWISMWEARAKFTAARIKPVRLGPIGVSASGAAALKKEVPLDDSAAPVDFYTWPTYTKPVPASILDKVAANRKAVVASIASPYAFATFSADSSGDRVAKGYSYLDRAEKVTPAAVCTPAEAADPKLKPIFERLYEEMRGEGSVSSVLTGDGVKFTWGRGLGHGGGLEPAFLNFITTDAAAKKEFLDCGITLEGKTWKIVDTESNTVQVGEGAIDLLNGYEPADKKKALLSVIVKLTRDHIGSAAQAQWDSFKKQFFYGVKPPDTVIQTWTPVAVCYVIHCLAWGKFAGWDRFAATGGDLKKILRLEVDFTGYYDRKKSPRGDYLLVNYVRGSVTPAPTMLRNMGKECMFAVLAKWADAAEMDRFVQPGDVVFQLGAAGGPYYGLQGTSKIFDSKSKYDIWIDENQGLPMAALIKKLEGLPKGETKATMDRYAAEDNPNRMKYGFRPQVAMQAVLHKNEGLAAAHLIEFAASADITLASNPDQYNAICNEIGLGKYDTWVEKNHALPMDRLIAEIDKLGYKEAKATRDWYASETNPKKQKWGLRPTVAMDAVLHKNEGQGAAWILNECAQAQISATSNPDQYLIIKKTLGIA
jgi:hypothetical protein